MNRDDDDDDGGLTAELEKARETIADLNMRQATVRTQNTLRKKAFQVRRNILWDQVISMKRVFPSSEALYALATEILRRR